jgi:hypothetical protein
MRFLAIGLIVILFSMRSVAQSPTLMGDPLFGIAYDPQKVHFEELPAGLQQKCAKLKGRYVAAWIYGHFKTTDSEYFLISGLMEFQEDKPGAGRSISPEEDDGLIVAIQGSKCLVDQAGYFYYQEINTAKNATPIKAPASVVSGILQDAFSRDVSAFGGRQEFLKQVDRDALLPIVRTELEKFEKESGE